MGYCRRSAGPSGSRRPTQRTQRRRGAPILAPSRCRHARRPAAESSALLTNRRRSSPPRDATAEPISVGWCKARRCAGALGEARGHAGGRRQHKCRWSAPQHSVARALRAPLLDAANTRCCSLTSVVSAVTALGITGLMQKVAQLEGPELRVFATDLVQRLQALVEVYTTELTARLRLEGPCGAVRGCITVARRWLVLFAQRVSMVRDDSCSEGGA